MFRLQRVSDLIQRELALLIKKRANDPRFQQVTITAIDLSRDFQMAKVFVSVIDDQQIKAVIDALNHAAGFFRHQLAHNVNLRGTPKLRFVYDESVARGQRLSQLINDIVDDKGQPE